MNWYLLFRLRLQPHNYRAILRTQDNQCHYIAETKTTNILMCRGYPITPTTSNNIASIEMATYVLNARRARKAEEENIQEYYRIRMLKSSPSFD